ncbi:MAG: hypothetical protein B7Y05_11060 [Polynucleobacter sp. 24-46-87]|jgi:hypothetical protein|uniref:hypothetical protein n=1 Tax=Polynucleobacter sp. 35-46-11 TaxID=1970425 RepID=UPI000BD99B78|nr:hypothetical protein [Polynucleobacter sp. 35-46-11]OYY21500.1 MAG: hypothetical protein B7Y67_01525 [Polynucleobacter sp. 35-46-11]OZA12908.1 MAG: hypothetical protein B7Y05_11060 [Polynucleobacter sp. 24-46-87]
MNKQGDNNLSTLFRRQLEIPSRDGINIKQELINQKYEKTDYRASAFLVDQKYVLNLDELI